MGKRKGGKEAPISTLPAGEVGPDDNPTLFEDGPVSDGEPDSPYDSAMESDGSEAPSIDSGDEASEADSEEGQSSENDEGNDLGEEASSDDEEDENGSGASSDDDVDDAILALAAGRGGPPRRRRSAVGPQVGADASGGPGERGNEGVGGLEPALGAHEHLRRVRDDGETAALRSTGDDEEDLDGSEEQVDGGTGRDSLDGELEGPDTLRAALAADPGSDSSEDERPQRNTIGQVPLVWYKDEDHIGYDREGQKLVRKGRRRDKLDALLARNDSAKDWRTIYDQYNDEEITLSKEELQLIQRIRQGRFPDVEINPYEPETDYYSRETSIHPMNNAPEPKRRFIHSKWEEKKVVKLVRALRKGWLKIRTEDDEEAAEPPVYLLWADDGRVADKTASGLTYIPPPKPPLPGHEESYNPPPEYLPTEEEREAALNMHAEDRPAYLPTGYPSLRQVPMYADFIKERFERCLDLYLCPRARRKRPFITDAKSLVPKLPRPEELGPFPNMLLLKYLGHTGPVRCVQPDPRGEWLASGSNDGTLRVWEVRTGRCMRTWTLGDRVVSVAWCPNQALELLAVACGHKTVLLCPGLGSDEVEAATGQALDSALKAASLEGSGEGALCRWSRRGEGLGLELHHQHPVTWVTWQGRGDYFATVAPTGNTRSVLVHQLSRGASQNPFRKNRGRVVRVAFHPAKPFFFVATQNAVRCYNLAKQALAKKLVAGSGSITSLAVHPGGDHIITGAEDARLAWYDMDFSTKPYKALRYHEQGLTGVAFHRSYPLFASASDDSHVQVYHGFVYQDLMENPKLTPAKRLRGHGSGSAMDLAFHPSQPWLFTAGEDAVICLFTN